MDYVPLSFLFLSPKCRLFRHSGDCECGISLKRWEFMGCKEVKVEGSTYPDNFFTRQFKFIYIFLSFNVSGQDEVRLGGGAHLVEYNRKL